MPRTTVPIYDGDDYERLRELRTAVTIAERAAIEVEGAPRRFGDATTVSSAVIDAREAYDAFVDAAAARAEEWVLSSIGHQEFRALLAAHPPRVVPDPADPMKETKHPEDVDFGVNTETFPGALLAFSDPDDEEHRTVLKAGELALDRVAKRLRRLSAGEFDSLWMTAYQLNAAGVTDPKATRYSIAARSDET